MIQRPGRKQITDSTSAAKWKYFGEIAASIVIMSIILLRVSVYNTYDPLRSDWVQFACTCWLHKDCVVQLCSYCVS